jgi:hypothetical protein
MVIDISCREEQLLKELGVPWNGWEYERQEFAELNYELESNGIPQHNTFEDYLSARIHYKRKMA